MKRLIFFIGFMTLVTVALIQLVSVEPDEEESGLNGRLPTQLPANVMGLTEVTVTLHQGDRVRWRLWAEEAQLRQDNQTSRLEGVLFSAFPNPSESSPEVVLTGRARTAFVSGQPQKIELRRKVTLTRGAEMEINTERLIYDSAEGTLVSPGPVRINTPGGEQYGDSMRYAINENLLTFTRPRFSR